MINKMKEHFDEIKSRDSFKEHLAFCQQLKTNNDMTMLEFHYSILLENDTNNTFYIMIRREFSNRGAAAEEFLLEKFESESSNRMKSVIVLILGSIKKGNKKKEVLGLIRDNCKNKDDSVRLNSIIALGWIGGSKEVDLLNEILLQDDNLKIRGNAASAMMQIYFSKSSTKKKSMQYLGSALQHEKDDFVLACMLVALQEISGKKLGISSKSGKEPTKDQLEKALRKALKICKV